MGDIDDFLPSKISASKYMAKLKLPLESVAMNLCAFSAAQEVNSKLQNQAKFDLVVFKTIAVKSYLYLLTAPNGYYS